MSTRRCAPRPALLRRIVTPLIATPPPQKMLEDLIFPPVEPDLPPLCLGRQLRPGLVSMAHGWGGAPDRDAEVRRIGGNTNRLASTDAAWDRYTGIPVMSNLPVDVVASGDGTA